MEFGVYVTAFGGFFQFGFAAFQCFDICDDELGVDGFDVGFWFDSFADVRNVGVVEAPNDMRDNIDFTDAPQELVA